jgi:hypothetical protein
MSRIAMPVALAMVVGIAACDGDSSIAEPEDVQAFNSVISESALVCTTITFDDQDPALSHGSFPIESVSTDIGTVQIRVDPNKGTRPVAAIYSGLTDGGPDPDLEGANDCPDCLAQKNMLIMLQDYPDKPELTNQEMFDLEGDSENGGRMIFEMADGAGMYFYNGAALIDDDIGEASISVAVDGVEVATATPLGDGTVEVVGGGPAQIMDSLAFRLSGSGAVDDIVICTEEDTPPLGNEGCTPGYWKQPQHFGNWPDGIDPNSTMFGDADVFNCSGVEARRPESGDICGMLLLDVLSLRGGGVNALARHAAAAYLNAASSVEYPYTVGEVIDLLNKGDKDALEAANESYCPLGRAELDD